MWILILLRFSNLNMNMKSIDVNIKACLRLMLSAAFFIVLSVESAGAHGNKKSDILIGAHGWYGFDIENIRPTPLTYNGYMTYEASVGFQTDPAAENIYAVPGVGAGLDEPDTHFVLFVVILGNQGLGRFAGTHRAIFEIKFCHCSTSYR